MRQLKLLALLPVICFACRQKPAEIKTVATDTTKQPTHTTDVQQDESTNASETLSLPASLSAFIPNGFSALDTASGDLNRDAYTDMILVLKRNGEDTSAEESERPMLLLLGQQDGTWKKAAENSKAVYCYTCGGTKGDPYQGLVIKNGYFSASFYGGAADLWTRTITFKYVPEEKSWYLHKDGSSSWYCCDDENRNEKETLKTTKDFGKVRFEDFDIYKD